MTLEMLAEVLFLLAAAVMVSIILAVLVNITIEVITYWQEHRTFKP